MERTKTATYLGFARRAGKLTLGIQAAETVKRGVYLLVADESVAPNNRKIIEKLHARFACPLVYVMDLETMTGKANCKLAVVRDEHLAVAIINAESKEEI